jgi:hypothetical protein
MIPAGDPQGNPGQAVSPIETAASFKALLGVASVSKLDGFAESLAVASLVLKICV